MTAGALVDRVCRTCGETFVAVAPPQGSARVYCTPACKSKKPRNRVYRSQPRAITLSIRQMRRDLVEDLDAPPVARPRTRRDCLRSGCNEARPCPFVGCRHHLYIDVDTETGSMKLNFPHREVWELAETCSLDGADRGGVRLETIGERINLTLERCRQLEVSSLHFLKAEHPRLAELLGLDVEPLDAAA